MRSGYDARHGPSYLAFTVTHVLVNLASREEVCYIAEMKTVQVIPLSSRLSVCLSSSFLPISLRPLQLASFTVPRISTVHGETSAPTKCRHVYKYAVIRDLRRRQTPITGDSEAGM